MNFLKPALYYIFLKSHLISLYYYLRTSKNKNNASEPFSVIIPTLLRSDRLPTLLGTLAHNPLVNEIIVINNSPSPVPLPFESPKFIIIDNPANNFVNPSWNQGYKIAKSPNIILCNDDLTIIEDPLPLIGRYLNDEDIGIVGCNFIYKSGETVSKTGYSKKHVFPVSYLSKRCNGFGCFMAFKKSHYSLIPNEIKIYCGDDWIFQKNIQKNRKNFAVCAPFFETEMSTTSSSPAFNKFLAEDEKKYEEFMKDSA